MEKEDPAINRDRDVLLPFGVMATLAMSCLVSIKPDRLLMEMDCAEFQLTDRLID